MQNYFEVIQDASRNKARIEALKVVNFRDRTKIDPIYLGKKLCTFLFDIISKVKFCLLSIIQAVSPTKLGII